MTVSRVLVDCDQCGKVIDDWVFVEWSKDRQAGLMSSEGYFCRWRCAMQFAVSQGLMPHPDGIKPAVAYWPAFIAFWVGLILMGALMAFTR